MSDHPSARAPIPNPFVGAAGRRPDEESARAPEPPSNPRLDALQRTEAFNIKDYCVACGRKIEPTAPRGRLCQEHVDKDRLEQAEKRKARKAEAANNGCPVQDRE